MNWYGASILILAAVLTVGGCDRKGGPDAGEATGDWTPMRIVKSPMGYMEWVRREIDSGIATKESLRKLMGERTADMAAKRATLLKEVTDADDRQTLQQLYDQTLQQTQATIAKLGDDLVRHQRFRKKLIVQMEQVRLSPDMPNLWEIVVPAGQEVEHIKQDLAALRLEIEAAGRVAQGGQSTAGVSMPEPPPQPVDPVENLRDVRQALELGQRALAAGQLDQAWAALSQAERLQPGLTPVRDGLRQTTEAMYRRGWRYDFGQGYGRDMAKATAWYLKAANGGHPLAQYKLGLFAQNGNPPNGAVAAQWYEKAAQQGLAKAQNNLGSMLCEGRLVRRDVQQGIAWLRKAAQQGDTNAQQNLRGMGQRW